MTKQPRIFDSATLIHDENFYYDFLDGDITVTGEEGSLMATLRMHVEMPSATDIVTTMNEYKTKYAHLYDDSENFRFTFAIGGAAFSWLTRTEYDALSASPQDFYTLAESAFAFEHEITLHYKYTVTKHFNAELDERQSENVIVFETRLPGVGGTRANLIEAIRTYGGYFFWFGLALGNEATSEELLLHNGGNYFLDPIPGIDSNGKIPGGLKFGDLRSYDGQSLTFKEDMIIALDNARKK
jgi:hypothetical protein